MSHHYSDPKREDDGYALPDLEVFYVAAMGMSECPSEDCQVSLNSPEQITLHQSEHRGWYWQACFPGCLSDSEPMGPFETEAEALKDAREGVEDAE